MEAIIQILIVAGCLSVVFLCMFAATKLYEDKIRQDWAWEQEQREYENQRRRETDELHVV